MDSIILENGSSKILIIFRSVGSFVIKYIRIPIYIYYSCKFGLKKEDF